MARGHKAQSDGLKAAKGKPSKWALGSDKTDEIPLRPAKVAVQVDHRLALPIGPIGATFRTSGRWLATGKDSRGCERLSGHTAGHDRCAPNFGLRARLSAFCSIASAFRQQQT